MYVGCGCVGTEGADGAALAEDAADWVPKSIAPVAPTATAAIVTAAAASIAPHFVAPVFAGSCVLEKAAPDGSSSNGARIPRMVAPTSVSSARTFAQSPQSRVCSFTFRRSRAEPVPKTVAARYGKVGSQSVRAGAWA